FFVVSLIAFLVIVSFMLNKLILNERKNIPYQYKKSKVMTKTEREIFDFIKNDLEPKGYLVLSQVRLADFVSVCDVKYKTKLWFILFNKIAKKHCDIIIVDKDNNVVQAIEINDFTHRADARVNRDVEVKKILTSANIKLTVLDKESYRKFSLD
ncbi:DUF2726 domain-containing protein, partial [Providencia stuartii]|uniref:DUF2726 domain-containing protein n=2 Tax=Enterobacterales TaxID=91347 RepID=UPI0034DDAE58